MAFGGIMKQIFRFTFGGLSREYYFRQLFFAALISAVYIAIGMNMTKFPPSMAAFAVVNAVIYPYSRFVYECIADFILGNNIIVSQALMLMTWKIGTMLMCWACAVLIAPMGLIYLYFYHRKHAQEES